MTHNGVAQVAVKLSDGWKIAEMPARITKRTITTGRRKYDRATGAQSPTAQLAGMRREVRAYRFYVDTIWTFCWGTK